MQKTSEKHFIIDEHLEYPVENIQHPVITNLSERDAKVLWHPFTQHQTAPFSIPIVRAEGVYLFDENGKRYIDAIASWWVNLHGHSHPYIAQKVAEQFLKLEQVIFAGFTHEPAVRLAERLLEILPPNQQKIFYSDNGSTSVEVAMKMAFQYFHNQGIRKKTKIIALENGYHGDTFGTMAVGAKSAFTAPFDPFLFEVIYLPIPVKGEEQLALDTMKSLMSQADEIAAFIFEPLIQGAGGMVMYEPEILESLIKLAKENGILTIADEIMTGFYRTGKMFATDYLTEKPDIFCLSKGLTGGAMALGVTSCTQEIYDAFLSDDRRKTLFHSHSFTANPLACTAGLASLDLLLNDETQDNIKKINTLHQGFIQQVTQTYLHKIADIRLRGTILAIEIKVQEGTSYFSNMRDIAYNFFLEKGILMRPLGNVIYLLTPYCITEEDLVYVYGCIEEFLGEI
ncbi:MULTISPECIES: adenosylmethionine--8-amino-7-oxononanoate transaminase [unclassified Arcicella]|uniref:adenosylmethionine--8-amino-7-oxononanoate transaminase n=1 Tax=unclassified Arcicella TaxID=2644986 RepID=UPI0028603434|nr:MULTISPECIES: adenosylmethionine--8-amino-7-oxononanoate transaminase [unclassified Arcicella]MDR6560278.1 adenosylmethionine-8-amino-7-oxononanoate aminotransferase [Arcicella sp. BE51]MDR6810116.1 adenosylmethionine-8-amino-7-oxononanoate aminotransferase [Arcicella sp. BE140]MDR6821465.1 adenosylmethionine-8-amino-7-oxononanoate aminotransferase [Arcicella sp. BE139]